MKREISCHCGVDVRWYLRCHGCFFCSLLSSRWRVNELAAAGLYNTVNSSVNQFMLHLLLGNRNNLTSFQCHSKFTTTIKRAITWSSQLSLFCSYNVVQLKKNKVNTLMVKEVKVFIVRGTCGWCSIKCIRVGNSVQG